MKPMIGVTSSYQDERLLMTSYDNVDSITNAGGVPLILPNITDALQVERMVDTLDGLLVTGGGI